MKSMSITFIFCVCDINLCGEVGIFSAIYVNTTADSALAYFVAKSSANMVNSKQKEGFQLPPSFQWQDYPLVNNYLAMADKNRILGLVGM